MATVDYDESKTKYEVYKAARDGDLYQLRKLFVLQHREDSSLPKMSRICQSKEDILRIAQSKMQGATPLIIAARNGHLDVVEFLVETCGVDVEMAGSVQFDGENIDGAPPLWCAAAAGHLNIVKYFLQSGAKVNNTTCTNSTPLRAACFDGHYDIVKYLVEHGADFEMANRHGHTCLMISSYKGHYKIVKYLVERGADVNRKSVKGNTALHDCAESGSLEVMKLLLDGGARMEKDSYGMTPLLAAAVTGHTTVVEFLIHRSGCQRVGKAEALELLGATFVDKKRDMLGALKFWRLALTERYRSGNHRLEKPNIVSQMAAYENAKEVKTLKELEELVADPDAMRMQALLVRERILGPAHPDTSYYIRYRGAVYADMGNFERCILLWMYALDMQQKVLDPLSPMTQSSFLSFAELFSYMMTENDSKKAQPVHFNDMMDILKKAQYELSEGMKFLKSLDSPQEKDLLNFHRLLVIILHLTSLTCKQEAGFSRHEQHEFRKVLYDLVHLNPRGKNAHTLLHLACSNTTTTVGRYPVCSFPTAEVVQLLLEVGASAKTVDNESNTPLHIAALNRPCRMDIIHMLLNCDAHFDARNKDNKMASQLLAEASHRELANPLLYINLQCLAAQVVKKSGISYEDKVPEKVLSFINMH